MLSQSPSIHFPKGGKTDKVSAAAESDNDLLYFPFPGGFAYALRVKQIQPIIYNNMEKEDLCGSQLK